MRKGRFICVCVEDGPFIGTDGGIFHDGPDLGAEVVDRLNQGLRVHRSFRMRVAAGGVRAVTRPS